MRKFAIGLTFLACVALPRQAALAQNLNQCISSCGTSYFACDRDCRGGAGPGTNPSADQLRQLNACRMGRCFPARSSCEAACRKSNPGG